MSSLFGFFPTLHGFSVHWMLSLLLPSRNRGQGMEHHTFSESLVLVHLVVSPVCHHKTVTTSRLELVCVLLDNDRDNATSQESMRLGTWQLL